MTFQNTRLKPWQFQDSQFWDLGKIQSRCHFNGKLLNILNTSPTSFAQLCRWVKARWNEPKKKKGEKHNLIKSIAFIN
jgi:hypothetical protein